MKKTKMPDPDKPLTSAEFARMRKMRGTHELPKAAQAAIRTFAGRPRSLSPKKPISFRFAADIVEHLKNDVDGYNGRVEAMLRKAMTEGRL